jgi:hypothetical protein
LYSRANVFFLSFLHLQIDVGVDIAKIWMLFERAESTDELAKGPWPLSAAQLHIFSKHARSCQAVEEAAALP